MVERGALRAGSIEEGRERRRNCLCLPAQSRGVPRSRSRGGVACVKATRSILRREFDGRRGNDR
jgi:hypothetical protein